MPAASKILVVKPRSTKRTKPKGRAFIRDGSNRPELKYTVATLNNTVMPGTGAVFTINALASGAGQGQRVGHKMTMKSFQISGNVSINSASTWSTAIIYLVYDKTPNNVSALYADIFDVGGNSGTSVLPKYDESDRFVMLKRWEFAQDPSNRIHNFTGYVKMSLPTKFSSNAAGIAGVNTGALYLCYACGDPAVFPLVNGVMITKYEDT